MGTMRTLPRADLTFVVGLSMLNACLAVPDASETEAASGETTSSTSTSPTSSTSATGSSSSAAQTTTTTEASSTATTSMMTTGDGGSTTEAAPDCCDAVCLAACGSPDECPGELLGNDPPQNSEAIDIAVVGNQIVWSTGFGRSLMLAHPEASIDMEMSDVADNSFVTRIASDDTHVYFLDYGAGHVRRASVPAGAVDLVSQVPSAEAGFGEIAVGDTHVYFSMSLTGNIFRAAKDLSDQDAAELVAEVTQPLGVAVDEQSVYFIDSQLEQVRRIAMDEVGNDTTGNVVVDAAGLSAIAVDDTHLYFAAGDAVRRAIKSGSNQGVDSLATGQGFVWDIDLDAVHAYFTSQNGNEIRRVVKDGSDEVEPLATATGPRGIALTCDGVYWADGATETMRGRDK